MVKDAKYTVKAMLQDSHIHLQDSRDNIAGILDAMKERRIGRIFCNGTSPVDWKEVKRLSEDERVIPFFGVHPWRAGGLKECWEDELRSVLCDKRSKIGEIGLDRARRGADFEMQLEVFRRQLGMASELKRSFAVHCVQAWDALIKELEAMGKGRPPFMVHWFSGSAETCRELLRLGAYISFSSRLLNDASGSRTAAIKSTPPDRVLVETDYPYMADAPKGVAPSAEQYFDTINKVYARAAQLKGMEPEEFEDRVWENGTIFLH